MASRKLKHYLLGHPITMVSSAPLGDIIQNREAAGWVAKWAIVSDFGFRQTLKV